MPRHFPERTSALVMLIALFGGLAACRQTPEGTTRVLVIGNTPHLRDPVAGPLSPGDALLVANVAQGLVRFDAAGNIVAGLAERWNVSDDGLSYIFRLSASKWPDGSKITAQQVARTLKRLIGPTSRNPLKDTLGAVDDIVAMTDRVIEIRLRAPRPNLLAILAQPEFGLVRNGGGNGPFQLARKRADDGSLRLTRETFRGDDDEAIKDEVLLRGGTVAEALSLFTAGKVDLVLGGSFADLPVAEGAALPRGRLRFDPASGLFGLVPVRSGDVFDNSRLRRLLSAAIDRDAIIAAIGVPGLTARATVLEPGLEGIAAPVAPAWFGTPMDQRRTALLAEASALLPKGEQPILRIFVPAGPGGDRLLDRLTRDWSILGLRVERAETLRVADFRLVDEVAPSTSPAWFLRRFHCGAVPVCDKDADMLLDAARTTPLPAQRSALLQQAAGRIDELMLFLPLAAPVRWSLVTPRLRGFAGNRFARHTLTDLEQVAGRGD